MLGSPVSPDVRARYAISSTTRTARVTRGSRAVSTSQIIGSRTRTGFRRDVASKSFWPLGLQQHRAPRAAGPRRIERPMTRPYVIIHTHTSIDGNIDVMSHGAFEAASRLYRDIALTPEKQVLNIDAYLNGKTSTED